MPYILRDGDSVTPGFLTVVGPDELSSQAELIHTYRASLKKTGCPEGRILGRYKVETKIPYAIWISLFREVDRVAIIELRAEILVKGWKHFHLGEAPMPPDHSEVTTITPESPLNRPLMNFMETAIAAAGAIEGKGFPKDSKEAAGLADAFANPLHAGIHPDFKAGLPEEVWIQSAIGAIKSWGAERWLRRMVARLREVFGGRPKEPIPHKNDVCPCKSGKKYGKCCGHGVEEGDPEDCKLGRHEFKDLWSKDYTGKFIRGCANCLKIEEAPYGEEVGIPSCPKILLIGCKTCKAGPSIADAEKLITEWQTWYRCGSCNAPFSIREAHVEHFVKLDFTHDPKWKITFLVGSPDIVELTFPGDSPKMAGIHVDCLKKSLPFMDTLSKGCQTDKGGLTLRTGIGSYSKTNKDFTINDKPLNPSVDVEFTH